MGRPLVIVESPAKARKIGEFLGRDFVVESSIGHIRDLPSRAAEVPEAYRGLPWASDGVDTENDFKPLYVVPSGRAKDQVRKLKQLLKDADEVYLATDEDREGESIAWHLLEVLSPHVPVKRMVFHEITPDAIRRAVENPRDLDHALVDAQETRRILDRLYGFRLSELLWRKSSGRSAGRVQSVATRLVVERERERIRFRAAGWWDLLATFAAGGATGAFGFDADLHNVAGQRVADRSAFDENGALVKDVLVLDESGARQLAADLDARDFTVRSVEQRPHTDRPKPPFMTSTLQQAAGSKLRFSAARTMQVAQRLYENGYITYMRTDSTTLSETALTAARAQAAELYGAEYVPDGPRTYNRKVKNAQEAHEAIRPAGDRFRLPEAVAREVGGDEARLYDLIWRRTVASQMKDAVGQRTTLRIGAVSSRDVDVEFSAAGTVITFAGHRRAYAEGADDVEGGNDDEERRLPNLAEGDVVDLRDLAPRDHTTSPPSRYTEASLIKALEERGIGRPSTWSAIVTTIQDRGYVWKKGTALIPSFTAFAVIGLLERHFPHLVDYDFTADLEDDLDRIARREKERVPWLRSFYFGDGPDSDGRPGLKPMVERKLDEIDAREENSLPIGTAVDGEPVVVRVGKYGPYLQHGDERASVPEDLPPDELTIDRALELLAAPAGDRVVGTDPETGLTIHAKAGRYGPYVQLGEVSDDKKAPKPKTASLFKDMSLETVTVEQALQLLSLPRVVGVDPDGQEITAQNGRYGPYIKKGTDSRSIASEDQLLTIDLDEALRVFAEPKRRRGQTVAAALKELGDDPVTGRPIVVKDGRFGAYITDGETNVTIPRGDSLDDLTPARAAELLADKRLRGPAPKRKTAAKKTTAKKTAAKKTAAKKTPATKTAAKKATAAKQASGGTDAAGSGMTDGAGAPGDAEQPF